MNVRTYSFFGLETTMNNVPALFVRLSAGILVLGMTVCAVQAETVVQVNLNGYVTGLFGDQVSSYQIQLFDNETPITVANYLQYVNNNAYNNTIIHRSELGDAQNPQIIQGGGYKLQINSNNVVTALNTIATYGTIQNESQLSNVRGTIAMARTSDPDSATSQWYVNVSDNLYLDQSQYNYGYAVFGQVAGEGMTLVDAVNEIPTYNINSLYDPNGTLGHPFSKVPLAADGSIFVTVVSMNVVSTVAWKGGASSASTDWGTLANWGSGTSVPNGAGVNLSIGSQASANKVIDLGSANRTVGNLYYTSGTDTTIQSTGGKSLILDNSGKTSLINVIGDHAISASVILNNNTIIDIDGSLAISGAVSGTGSLALNNTGTLTLTGSNSYTGKTLITNGMLTAGKAASLPGYNTAGMITVYSDAALAVQAGDSTWTASQIDTLRTYATFNSGAFLGIDTTGGDFPYGSNITGSLGLAKLGSNTLTLTGSNTYTGKTEIVEGTLSAGKTASLPGYNASGMVTVYSGATLAVLAGDSTGQWAAADIDTLRTYATFNSGSFLGIDTTGGNFSYGSVITGSLGLTKLGTNTLTLTGSNTFTGAVNFNAGLINAAALNNLGAGTALNFNGGGLQFDGVFDPSVRTMSFQSPDTILDTQGNIVTLAHAIGNNGPGGLTKIGTGTLVLGGVNTFTGAVNFNGGLIKAASLYNLGAGDELNFNGGGLQFNGVFDPSGRTITFESGGAILDTQTNNVTMANSIGNGGAGGLTKQGSGTLTLSKSPNYNGATVVNAGTLQLGSGATLPSATTVSLTASGATLDLNANSQTIASLTGVTGTEVKLGGGTLTVANSVSTTFAGAITSSSSGSLTKTGTGTFTLTGSNTFSGAVNFNGGLINASSLSNLGAKAALNFNGGALQFGAAFDPSSDKRIISFQSGGATLDTQAYNITVANAIGNGGAGGLTKNGSGTLEFDGTVSYSGDTTINAGVLKINNNLSTTLSAISGDGTLEVDGSSTMLTAGSIKANTLTIGAGAEVVIAAISGASIEQELEIQSVAEPGTLVLLGIAALATLFAAWRRK
jgi:autotransporter-associated beta strand protein